MSVSVPTGSASPREGPARAQHAAAASGDPAGAAAGAAVTATAALAASIKEQEERLLHCVHCGFCLPACPTYRRLGDEADSPRGRLHLMRAVVEGRLDPGADAFQLHIGRCLGCRACEPVCPSGVAYGQLLELARETGNAARRPSLLTRALLGVFGSQWSARPAMAASRILRATRLPALAARLLGGRTLARWTRGPALAMAMLSASAPARLGPGGSALARHADAASRPPGPASSPDAGRTRPAHPEASPSLPPAPAPQPARDDARPTVGILSGCVQAGLFGRVNAATARVLEANGYPVVAVKGQGCCGALHAHAGELEAARAMARRNVEAFESAGVDLLAMNASGCGAAMAEYASLLAGDAAWAARAEAVSARVRDVSELLADAGPVRGAPMPMSATYDAPCHLLHAQGVSGPPGAVMAAIPELRAIPLPGSSECCGGAGIYGITHRRLGGWIGGDKARSVAATGADVLVTGNPGCMMQIGAELALQGSAMPVIHLVELLDESYRRGGLYRKPPRRPRPGQSAS